MSKKRTPPINLARVIYDAYPNSDLLNIDPEEDLTDMQALRTRVNSKDGCGDGFFAFIVNEVYEGGEVGSESVSPGISLEPALKCLDRAHDDLSEVIGSLTRIHMQRGDRVIPVKAKGTLFPYRNVVRGGRR